MYPAEVPLLFTTKPLTKPNKWFWDFGDGNTSNEQNPVHVYTTPGTYDVKLIAENYGGKDSIIKNNLISIEITGGDK